MQLKNLSVFFPLYNEEGNVRDRVEKTTKILDSLKLNYEILLINDGSSDKTLEVARRLESDNKNLRVISLNPNRGYGAALRAGFEHDKYTII